MPDLCQNSNNQDLIWDYFQNENPESFEGSHARLGYLVRKISPPASVLNIGCGSGIFERLAVARGLIVHSLDPSATSIQQLRSALSLGDKAKVGYIQEIRFSDSAFDFVVVSEVLEHLKPETMRQGLVEIRRVLKPGGCMIGTVPSREDLKQQVVVCPCCGKRFHRWGHEQSFDTPKMRSVLSEYFDVVAVIERPFVTWAALNWKGTLLAAAKCFLWRMGHHGSNEHIYFEATKPGRRLDP